MPWPRLRFLSMVLAVSVIKCPPSSFENVDNPIIDFWVLNRSCLVGDAIAVILIKAGTNDLISITSVSVLVRKHLLDQALSY